MLQLRSSYNPFNKNGKSNLRKVHGDYKYIRLFTNAINIDDIEHICAGNGKYWSGENKQELPSSIGYRPGFSARHHIPVPPSRQAYRLLSPRRGQLLAEVTAGGQRPAQTLGINIYMNNIIVKLREQLGISGLGSTAWTHVAGGNSHSSH